MLTRSVRYSTAKSGVPRDGVNQLVGATYDLAQAGAADSKREDVEAR